MDLDLKYDALDIAFTSMTLKMMAETCESLASATIDAKRRWFQFAAEFPFIDVPHALSKAGCLSSETYLGAVNEFNERWLNTGADLPTGDLLELAIHTVLEAVERYIEGVQQEFERKHKAAVSVEGIGGIFIVSYDHDGAEERRPLFAGPESKEALVAASLARFENGLYTKLDSLSGYRDLSVRVHNCLHNEWITHLGDLLVRSERELLRTPNFGTKSMAELKAWMNGHGLYFESVKEEEFLARRLLAHLEGGFRESIMRRWRENDLLREAEPKLRQAGVTTFKHLVILTPEAVLDILGPGEEETLEVIVQFLQHWELRLGLTLVL